MSGSSRPLQNTGLLLEANVQCLTRDPTSSLSAALFSCVIHPQGMKAAGFFGLNQLEKRMPQNSCQAEPNGGLVNVVGSAATGSPTDGSSSQVDLYQMLLAAQSRSPTPARLRKKLLCQKPHEGPTQTPLWPPLWSGCGSCRKAG